MKALAILKDSIRESWDSKILLVLLVLSMLFSLLLASIGYTPVPASDILDRSTKDFRKLAIDKGTFQMGFGAPQIDVQYEVIDFTETVPASNPANAVYTFKLIVTPKDVDPEQEFGVPRRKQRPGDEKPPADPKDPKKKTLEVDTFGQLVGFWNLSRDVFFKLGRNPNPELEKEVEKSLIGSVTSSAMEEFVKERYNYHYNFQIKSVTRKEAPLKGPQEFTVVTAQSDPRAWPHYSSLFFGAIASKSFPPPTSLGSIVFFIQNTLLNGVGAGIAIMLGIIVTSFFIPNMMRKGSIDLMLSKPIGRVQLLLNKYLGGLSFMFIFATVTVGSVWLVFGLRSGLWNPKFLLLIPLWTYAFGILYALSTLISVWTRSAIASLLLTLAFNGMLWVTATTYNALDGIRKTPLQEQMPTWVNPTADFVNAVLPRTRDLDVITTKLIADVLTENDQQKSGIGDIEMPSVFGSVGVSFAWIAGMLGLACWRFTRKDY